jgi:5-hydroxyisourate hydrolase-like protein (transthyretin family)
MKKNFLFLLLIPVIFFSVGIAQQLNTSIEKRWKMVDELAAKQLPESALKEVEAILVQAQKENNRAEVIKAMVYKMRFTLDKNPDEAPALIGEFEAFTDKSNDPAEKSLLHSMTADLYAQYYQKDAYTINNRTELTGFVPEDMKEWTKNIYFDKINNHLAASMDNPAVLQHTDALKFAVLLEKGADSRILQPTLFDFLGYRRIQILQSLNQIVTLRNPLTDHNYSIDVNQFISLKLDTAFNKSIENQIIQTYQGLLSFQLKAGNVPALLNLNLERLEYFHSKSENAIGDSLYLGALNRLIQQYSNNELVVEVLAEKATYFLDKSYDNEENVSSESKKQLAAYKHIAYNTCNYGIEHFPTYKRIGLLINIRKEINQKELNINYPKIAKLGSNLNVKINSSNISLLQLTVYRINASAMEYYKFKEKERNNSTYPNRTLVETRQIAIKPDPDFGTVITEIGIKPTDYGIYEFSIELKDNKKARQRAKGIFTVSDLAFMKRMNTPNAVTLYVLDRITGQPQNNVLVKVYNHKWTGSGYSINLTNTVRTDNTGLSSYTTSFDVSNEITFFERGRDVYFNSSQNTYYNSDIKFGNEKKKLNFFTDRSIYRPGQTVYFKGIAYYSNSKKQEVTANAEFEVELLNANSQKIITKKLKTNEFGSFSGEFVLPQGGLNGVYSIRSEGGYNSFLVEEYKRPTFEVSLDKPVSEIRFGDKVTMNGKVKAYAGYSIGDANIKYRVVRRVHHFCWWFSEPEEEITNGIAKSDKSGTFNVSFVPVKGKPHFSVYSDRAYTYTIYADVTDQKGETQHGEQMIAVGDKSLFIIAEVPEMIDKGNSFKQEVTTQTINDEKINSVITYSLYRLTDINAYNESLNNSNVFKEGAKVLSGNFHTKETKLELNLSNLASGRYKFIFVTKDSHGKEVKLERVFILFSKEDKHPPVKSYVWLSTSKADCFVGETAHIQFGTSTKNSMIFYELMQGNKVLESRWIPFTDEIKTFDIPFLESYGGGVTAKFSFIKDEQFFTRSIQVVRKVVERKLTPSLRVFRNKLQPGEKAEWEITIPESYGNKKAAEIMVDMYDASLDKFRLHTWNFNPVFVEPFMQSPGWSANAFETESDNTNFYVNIKNVKGYQIDELNWFGLDMSASNRRGRIMFRSSGKFTAPVIKMDEEVMQESLTKSKVRISIADVKGNDEKGIDIADLKSMVSEVPVQIRTNFNETAFFYPQLRTDSLGNVKFTFTAPESLTRWNIKMLTHTKDLYFGQGEKQVVTQKDLMVQMNLPRFVRRSDKLVLSANVINLTDKELKASVVFELLDPSTEKSISLKDATPKNVTLAANETKAVEWEVSEFSPYELVICKVTARAGNFSDGEQKYLPVLPDKVLVTESMPLIIRGNQRRTFNFESFIKNSPNVETKNLAVEFSSNPTWYAVQALPTLAAPENESAIDYFAAYYVNSLAGYLANANPKIAGVFEHWKKAGGSREALLSNLEKNSELKNMLLEETPWVMAAKDETEQKKQIALLFDLNMQKNQAQQYMEKLVSLQMPSGGFSWYKGMPESRYITQEIMLNLGRLNRMTGGKVLTPYLLPLTSALKFLDLEIAHDFEILKKNNKNCNNEMSVDNMQLFYLHLRSEYPDIPVAASAQEAVKFYTSQSEKYWTSLTLYGKAMMAVVAQRNGKTTVANDILKSLKENAMKTDELGMYWAKNTAGYYWNEQPVSVQAAIIEAFAEVTKNTGDVDELKLWLLKQKQTQRWNSPLATVDAIYALLQYGTDWLANSRQAVITVGKKMLQPQSVEAGTGYFKETMPVAEIRPEMGRVTVSNSEGFTPGKSDTHSEALTKSGIGWGAMYWQYFQDLDKVTGQSGPLKITKKLFVEKMSATAKTLLPIEQTELKKGDKVITRLVITTDRNLEYVALKDLRAACFEPVNQLSGCLWKEGVCYYQTTKDASTQFFFSFLPKGTYVFEYELWANSAGTYTSGIASLQCQYAPEFVSHTGGERIEIK